jgi:hypothetical protein
MRQRLEADKSTAELTDSGAIPPRPHVAISQRGAVGGMIGRGNRSTRFVHLKSHMTSWARTRAVLRRCLNTRAAA